MIAYEKENNGFQQLLDFVVEHENDKYLLIYEGKQIIAEYITMYETDNSLDEDDPNYEEFNAIDFKNTETGEEFEVTYLNLPKEIICNGKKIY